MEINTISVREMIPLRIKAPALPPVYTAANRLDSLDHLNFLNSARLGSALSNLLLEAQFESIPQERTLLPKATKRRFIENQMIPKPNVATLLAWQSVCEIVSASIRWPTLNENQRAMCPWLPVEHLTPYEQDSIYYTIIVLPTFPEVVHLDGESISTLYSTGAHLINADDGSYGFYEAYYINLYRQPEARIRAAIQRRSLETETPAGLVIEKILSEFPALHSRPYDFLRSRFANNTSDNSPWQAPTFYNEYYESTHIPVHPWGIQASKFPSSQFYRLLRNNGLGMRFTERLAAREWVESYAQALIESHYFLENISRQTEILGILDATLRDWRKYNQAQPGGLVIDQDSIKNLLGL